MARRVICTVVLVVVLLAGCKARPQPEAAEEKELVLSVPRPTLEQKQIIDEAPISIDLVVKDTPQKAGDAGTLEVNLLPKWDFRETILDISVAGSARLGAVRDLTSVPAGESFLPSLVVRDHRQRKIKALKTDSPLTIQLPFSLAEKGYGYFMVQVLGSDGVSMEHGSTAILYFLGLDSEVLFSRHSQQDLDIQKLEKDLTRRGRNKEEIRYEVEKLRRSGAKVEKRSSAGVRHEDSQGDGGPSNSITIEGHISFTDIDGTTHPVRFATVQIFDDEAPLPGDGELVATVQTDDTGFYTATVDDNDGDGTGRDIYVVVQANGDTIRVEDFTTGGIHALDSRPPVADVADNTTQTIDITASNNAGSSQNVAFEVYEAINYLSRYLAQLGEPLPAQVEVRLPGTGAYYDYVSVVLALIDVHHWDVMHHEYGHFIQDQYNTANSPGGYHASGNNDCAVHGKDGGIRLAWGESWPTFFGSMAQNEMGLAALGIPEVGDATYNGSPTFLYSLETETDGYNNGEGCERALMRVLWDLYDNVNDDEDQGVALGAQVLWDVITDNHPYTFSAFWNALISGRTEAEKVAFGRILTRYGVSAEITAPPDAQAYNGGAVPTFQWNAPVSCAGAGNTYYSVKYLNDALTALVYESPWQTATSFTPTNDQLNQIFVGPDGNLRWLVVFQDRTTPQTGNYYGLDRTLVDDFDVPDRNPVDIVLALDISGSMAASVPGSTLNLRKLKLLQQAVEIFVRTWAFHAITGDRIGVLYFTTDISTLPGGPPALLDVAANADTIVTDVGTKTRQSCTAIGGVIQNSYQLLTEGTNKKVIILFTDGEQTHNPFIDEEGSPAKLKIRQIPSGSVLPFDAYWCGGADAARDPSGNPISPDGQFLYEHDIQIHTIGVGVDGAGFEDLINRVSSETSALHHYTSAPDEELDIFFTNDLIDSLKTASLEIVKTQKGSLAKSEASSISVPINSAARSLTLVTSWKGDDNPNALTITVRAPGGASVTPTSMSAGDFFRIMKYDFPLSTQQGTSLSASGNWHVTLRGQAQVNPLFYQFTAVVDERCFHYSFSFPQKDYGTGDAITLTATLTQNGKPLRKSSGVWVDVIRPVNSPDNLIAKFLPRAKVDTGSKASSRDKATRRSDDRELGRPFEQAVAALLRSNPKVAAQLRAKTSSSLRLYDDGRKEHGDLKAGDGIYSNRLKATQVAGCYQFQFKVLASTECGRVERAGTACTLVAVNTFDPKQSHISCKALKKNLYALSFRPQDRFGNLLGPGKVGTIQILSSTGALKGSVVDCWDGSYQQLIEVPRNQNPRIAIVVKGRTLASIPLWSLMERKVAAGD